MSSATEYQAQDLPFSHELDGIGAKTVEVHHDKLYVGYVNKMKAIASRLKELAASGEDGGANQTYSELRALRRGETFATNGVFLHEVYFANLGGDGTPAGAFADALTEKYGSVERAIEFINATSVAMRGWTVIAWDMNLQRLKVYGCDAHNQGGIWGCVPIVAIDLYEHSYYMDHGSNRKAYLDAFWKNFNWQWAAERFEKARALSL